MTPPTTTPPAQSAPLIALTPGQIAYLQQRRAKKRRRAAQEAATAGGHPLPFPVIP